MLLLFFLLLLLLLNDSLLLLVVLIVAAAALSLEILMTIVCFPQTNASFPGLHLVGGVDLSFVKEEDDDNDDTSPTPMACAAYVVCRLPSLEVVYQEMEMVELTAPYIPGFLVSCLKMFALI